MLQKGKKFMLFIFVFLLLSVVGICAYRFYFFPKLTIWDDDKRAENFRSMDKIFPSKWIHRSSKPHQLNENYQKLEISYLFDERNRQMTEMLERSGTTGILVVKNDTIVYEQYFQGNTQNAKNNSWSVAKSFVSALVGIAIADGYISSVNDPITKYLPELAQTGYRDVPIKHILQMSSGVKFSEDYLDNSSDINNLLPQIFLQMRPIKKVALDFPSESPSGKKFHYISLDTQILGMLIERATGKSVSAYLQTKLWEPLGAESEAFWSTDNYNTELSFCCLNATLRDYAKFGLLYLHNGYYNGKQILPANWIEESIVPDSPHLQVGATDAKDYGRWGYQYQWWIPTGSTGDYLAVGIWGQYIYINPQKNVVIVKTSTGSWTMATKDDDEAVAMFRAISQKLE